jgi:hypothetical protein
MQLSNSKILFPNSEEIQSIIDRFLHLREYQVRRGQGRLRSNRQSRGKR